MLNELAARGFIDDDTCHLHEEMVGSDRALIFSKSGVVVGLPKLGAPRGYLPHSAVDQEDRQQILYKLQTAMHDRAIPEQPAPVTTSSPASRKSSSVSKRWSTATLTSSDHEDAASTSGPQNASLENCGLIKFVKVHWKQSKNIRDNLHAINPNQDAYPMNPANPEGSLKVETFKAVIVWANKKDKKEGIKLLEKMIVERLGKPVQEVRKSKYLKEAEEVVEVADDGARWLAFHKENVVVGFPGSRGDEAFIEAVQAMDTVWN